MPSHSDLLKNMAAVRAALLGKYKWFIHTTPEVNIPGIRRDGLRANRDAPAPDEVITAFQTDHVPVLCLHPLGAKRCPRGAYSTLTLSIGDSDPKFVSFAVEARDLPEQVGLDWSNDWWRAEKAIRDNANITTEELVAHIVDEYGSIAAYQGIGPERLRVFCKQDSPADPSRWNMLREATNDDILRHD